MEKIVLSDLTHDGQLTLLGKRVINGELVVDGDLKEKLIKVFNETKERHKHLKDRGVCADW